MSRFSRLFIMLKSIFLRLRFKFYSLLNVFFSFDFLTKKKDCAFYTLMKNQLHRKNVSFGSNTVVYNTIFSTSSKGDQFIIGDNCTITGSVLLGHDASPTVHLDVLKLKENPWEHGARLSYRNPIVIGNNVFVGYGSIILPGIKIGDNVVIAAGSVVTKDVPSDCVYGGNPAKFIKSISDYKDKFIKIYETDGDKF